MKNPRSLILLTSIFLVFFSNKISAQELTLEEKVDSVIQLMTIEEKVGQMNLYNGFWDVTGPAPEDGSQKLKYENLKAGLVGAMLNVQGADETRKLQELVQNETRLGIPLLFGFDVIHGHKTIFPIPLAESASWDLEAMERSARIAAVEASAMGINWTFAPMVDITRDARWGRVMEGAGEDPYLASKIAIARVKGFQGNDLTKSNTIAATAKHFAAYGFVSAGREYNNIEIGMPTLHNVVLPPFKACVDADIKSVMNSFSMMNGIPATGDAFLQREILKGAWDFRGFVVSDWFSTKEMEMHGFARNLEHSAELGAKAGSDMDMESYAYVNHLASLVRKGQVDETIIDDAARRILRVKFELGLFNDPFRYCDAARETTDIYNDEHKAAALEIAKKSIVLLKNEGELLPLNENQDGLLIIGELAGDKNSPLGNWRLAADNHSAVSVLEGIDEYHNTYQYAPGVKLVDSAPGFAHEVHINKKDTTGFADALRRAAKAEKIVMVLGEHGYQSGEGRSRANIGLPGLQQELLEAVYRVNPNIILVLMNGRPLAIPWADEHIPAILECWQLGSMSGHAIAQTLFGKNNPSGKLPMTFPRHVGQLPLYYNSYSTGRPSSPANIVFWSHYIDESNKPLYPFGYGLSYTSFEYADLEVIKNVDIVEVSVTITNTGPVDGVEIAQLYIRDHTSTIVRPIKELKGFKRLSLNPNESKRITFKLTPSELGYYNLNGKFLVEPGRFDVMVGSDSTAGLTGNFYWN